MSPGTPKHVPKRGTASFFSYHATRANPKKLIQNKNRCLRGSGTLPPNDSARKQLLSLGKLTIHGRHNAATTTAEWGKAAVHSCQCTWQGNIAKAHEKTELSSDPAHYGRVATYEKE